MATSKTRAVSLSLTEAVSVCSLTHKVNSNFEKETRPKEETRMPAEAKAAETDHITYSEAALMTPPCVPHQGTQEGRVSCLHLGFLMPWG